MSNLDPTKMAMPLSVADQYFMALERLGMRWACQESGRDEWELLPGASLAAIDSDGSMDYSTLHQEKRTRETGPALFATPVSFVRKMGKSCPTPSNQNAP